MIKASITILLTLLSTVTIPLQAQATFPGESIIFGYRGQSNEQKDKHVFSKTYTEHKFKLTTYRLK